ncbi:SAM-dependent methyltransferase [Plantactinospora sp. CA-294935]|uniref:SAM-dependent methyltransferase n=1 Tax=Plantactinospora sp. CA-294935 TaxID=3240012 RepID=UPI003D94DFFE
MTAPNDGGYPAFPIDVPTSARMYDYSLGGKDNFPADRAAVQFVNSQYPSSLDVTRENRLFLYRAVRFLARDLGIRQFLDLGSGLPTQANVHQVAQQFQPGARVVYVDVDPIVLAHGRALLADDETTRVIAADVTEPERILADSDVRKMIDFSRPVAVLLLSVTHSIVDDDKVRHLLAVMREAMAPDSYLGYSQLAGTDRAGVDAGNAMVKKMGITWKNRMVDEVAEFVRDFEPVEPGLVDVKTWRPDPTQPPLAPVDEALRPYLGRGAEETRFYEYGGVLRRP